MGERVRSYSGEAWTDEHGTAVVPLPPYLHGRETAYAYTLEPATEAQVTAILEDARLTITSAVPHLKVAWRLSPRPDNVEDSAIDGILTTRKELHR